MATETVRSNFEAFADPQFDGLFDADPHLNAAFAEAVTESENLEMLKSSVVALGLTGHQPTAQELLAPYEMIAANLKDESRVNQLVEIFDGVFQLKDKDHKLLYNLCLHQERYAEQCVRKFNMLLPDGALSELADNQTAPTELSPVRQKLAAYTSATPSQRRLDQQVINEMIDDASTFLSNAAKDSVSKKPRLSAYIHFMEPLKQALPKLSEADVKAWLEYAKFTIGLSETASIADYDFYPAPGTSPANDKVLDVYEQAEAVIVSLVDKLAQQEPRRIAASLAAAAAITIAIPAIANRHSTPQVSLASAEQKAAQTVLAITSNQSAPVQLSPAAESVMQNVAQGATVAPQVLTTAAVLTSHTTPDSSHAATPVSIEGVTSVHASSVAATKPTVAGNVPNALVVKAPPAEVTHLYENYRQMGAQTLLVNPSHLPAGGAEYIEGQTVSAAAAQSVLGKDAADKVVVSIDPTVKSNTPAPEQATSETTSTTKPAPATTVAPAATPATAPATPAATAAPVKHNFDPSNPVDALYQALQPQVSSQQEIFAIMGNGMAEGREHPGTVQGAAPGVYVPISSLSEATLNDRNVGVGINQWTPGEKEKVEATQLGVSPDTTVGQATVVVHDLKQPDIKHPGNTYEQSIVEAPNLDAATAIMESHWERPATTSDAPQRERYAEEIKAYITQNVPLPFNVIPLTDFERGGVTPPAPAPAPAPTTTTPTTSTTVAPTTTTTPAQPSTAETTTPPSSDSQDTNGTSKWLDSWSKQAGQQTSQSGTDQASAVTNPQS